MDLIGSMLLFDVLQRNKEIEKCLCLSSSSSLSSYIKTVFVISTKPSKRSCNKLFQIYLPCYLIVVLAWVSFWVDREQTAARIAMGITTVLTMATLIGSARTSLPKVSYIKSLELFLIMCFLFVFSAILEYAFVSYLVFKNREEEREREAMHKKYEEVREIDFSKFVSTTQCRVDIKAKVSGFLGSWALLFCIWVDQSIFY